jgi:restriction system protein
MTGRQISLDRIGEYLFACVHLLADNPDGVKASDINKEIEKRIDRLSEYELSPLPSGKASIRWQVTFRFWTIGLVKGGYIKKQKNVWYLTDKGNGLVTLTGMELVWLTRKSYLEWKGSVQAGKGADIEGDEDLLITEQDLDYSANAPVSNMKIKPDEAGFD